MPNSSGSFSASSMHPTAACCSFQADFTTFSQGFQAHTIVSPSAARHLRKVQLQPAECTEIHLQNPSNSHRFNFFQSQIDSVHPVRATMPEVWQTSRPFWLRYIRQPLGALCLQNLWGPKSRHSSTIITQEVMFNILGIAELGTYAQVDCSKKCGDAAVTAALASLQDTEVIPKSCPTPITHQQHQISGSSLLGASPHSAPYAAAWRVTTAPPSSLVACSLAQS